MIRSRSGGLVGALTFSTLSTGILQICMPLELRQLHASPSAIGVTLAMFGFGMFAFEWSWGVVADHIGYRIPLVASQLLYGAAIVLLARADSVPLIAAGYFLASGMMVAVGPVGRSYLGTNLHPTLRATGLALLAAQWVIASAIGSGAGGQLIERFPIRDVILGAAALPVISGLIAVWLFRNYSFTEQRRRHEEDGSDGSPVAGTAVVKVMVATAAIAVLTETGAGGELALVPLLVTSHLHLSAASAGAALLAVGLIGGALLVPGGIASDRWGRRPTMIAGCVIATAGFTAYALAGSFAQVIGGAALRAAGGSLVWPAVTAWVSESVPRRRHALFMGLFGEFENAGITLGPIVGGVAWSAFGIQAAFLAYAVSALLGAFVVALTVSARRATTPRRAEAGLARYE